jgi:hypothetical protein
MTPSESELLALLRELDDPVHLEWPQGYDRRTCAEPFGRLVARLEQDFAVPASSNKTPKIPANTGASTCLHRR